jgi:hypothetical protein
MDYEKSPVEHSLGPRNDLNERNGYRNRPQNRREAAIDGSPPSPSDISKQKLFIYCLLLT